MNDPYAALAAVKQWNDMRGADEEWPAVMGKVNAALAAPREPIYRDLYRDVCGWLNVPDNHTSVAFKLGMLQGKALRLQDIEERAAQKQPALGAPYGKSTLNDAICDTVFDGAAVMDALARRDPPGEPLTTHQVSDVLDAVVVVAREKTAGES